MCVGGGGGGGEGGEYPSIVSCICTLLYCTGHIIINYENHADLHESNPIHSGMIEKAVPEMVLMFTTVFNVVGVLLTIVKFTKPLSSTTE